MEPKTACKVETEEEFNRHTCWLGQEEPGSTTLASSIPSFIYTWTSWPEDALVIWDWEETGHLTNAGDKLTHIQANTAELNPIHRSH